jgi:Fe-S-cluster containining protein
MERSLMASELGISDDKFTLLYTWRKYGVLSIKEKTNYDCVFLQINKSVYSCRIYSVRPAQCRTFPFWPEILESMRSWEEYSLSCPGMNMGEFHSGDEISKIAVEYIFTGVAKFL